MTSDLTGTGTLFEGMISLRALIESKSRPIKCVYYDEERKKSHASEYAWLGHRADESGFEIVLKTADEISAMTDGDSHGGVCAVCGERDIPRIRPADVIPDGFYLMLEGIEDPFNFGFAVRAAYAAGADGLILSERNWMSAAGTVCRSSAGASERIPVYTADSADFTRFFKEAGYVVVAAEQKESAPMWKSDLKKPLLLIVGGEKRGISRALLDRCERRVSIPYGRDFPQALSAASAAAVLCFEVARQNR